MPSSLANMGISFNPVYMIREQFKNDMLLKNGLVDLKTGAEVKAQRQFDSINQIGSFLTKSSNPSLPCCAQISRMRRSFSGPTSTRRLLKR